MFVKIKDLLYVIDSSIKYVNEAKVNHNNISEKKYQLYMQKMKDTLFARLTELKRISTNGKLIAKYENTIKNLF